MDGLGSSAIVHLQGNQLELMCNQTKDMEDADVQATAGFELTMLN